MAKNAKWWAQLESNKRPESYELSALPLSYTPALVRVARFERAVSCARGKCFTGLSYTLNFELAHATGFDPVTFRVTGGCSTGLS